MKNVCEYSAVLYRYDIRIAGQKEHFDFYSDIKLKKEQLDLTLSAVYGLTTSCLLVKLARVIITADKIEYKKEKLFD